MRTTFFYILLLLSFVSFGQNIDHIKPLSAKDLGEYKLSHPLTYSIDSLLKGDSVLLYHSIIGDSIRLRLDNSETLTCQLKDIEDILTNRLSSLNENGFALARIDIIRSSESNKIDVKTTKGEQYYLDSIVLKEPLISSSFLQQILDIKTGDLYQLSKIRAIQNRLETVPFLKLNSEPLLYFYDGKFKIRLDLKKIGTNEFNGIVGLVPDNSNPEITTYRLNGNLNLSLNNTFKQGESFDFKWNRASENIQTLNTNLKLPFLFNSPYSLEGGLDFLQKDSSFLNVDYNISVAFQTGFNKSVSAFLNQKISTNLIPGSTANSSRSTFYGTSLLFQDLNHFLIPTKGYSLQIKASVGERTLNSSSEADSILLEISNINDLAVNLQVPVKSTITQIELNLQKYWQIKQRLILFQEIQSKVLLNPYLLSNEMMFIGGINTVRGFDNSSLSGSQYYISRNEIRFHLERFSFLSAFVDFTELISNQINTYNRQRLLSLGLGGQISSKAGVFSLYYALSKQGSQAIFFRDAKIHIGFKNNF